MTRAVGIVEACLSPRVLLVNGSLSGRAGNTALVLDQIARHFDGRVSVESLVLVDNDDPGHWESRVRASDGFVFATGTYWDSWGSPLQRFLESLTSIEATDAWLGKPAAVLVTMHSVGGKGVLTRLQGVLNSLGLMIPPLTGWVYSAAAEVAIASVEHPHHPASDAGGSMHRAIADDLWRMSDLEIIAHNLVEALRGSNRWRAWPVDREHFGSRWIEPIAQAPTEESPGLDQEIA